MGSTRRAFLIVAGGAAVLKAGGELVSESPSTDQPSSARDSLVESNDPAYEETQELVLDDQAYYAEGFRIDGDGWLEYKLNVLSGWVGTRLYIDDEYEKFKRGYESENRFDRGNHIRECFTGNSGKDRKQECGLIESGKYYLVCIPGEQDDVKAVLDYQIYV